MICRAKQHGWENTYTFTKAMGEMLITNERENIPVVIIRPSVIESAYREPFPGWIEGNRYFYIHMHFIVQPNNVLQNVYLFSSNCFFFPFLYDF